MGDVKGRLRAKFVLSSVSIFLLGALPALCFADSPQVSQPPAAATQKSKALRTLIVFDLTAENGVGPGTANLLTEVVIDRVSKLNRYKVIGQKDIDKMMAWEQNKQFKGCSDTKCLIQIAGALGADFYIEGSLGAMGKMYIITLKLIDAYSVSVLARDTIRVGRDENIVTEAMGRLTDVVMGVADRSQLAALEQTHSYKPPVYQYPMNPYKIAGHATFWPGLAVVLTGGVFAIMSNNSYADLENAKDPSSMAAARNSMETYNKLSIASYTIGGAAMATGLIMWILSPSDEEWWMKTHKVSFAPACDGSGCGLAIGGKW